MPLNPQNIVIDDLKFAKISKNTDYSVELKQTIILKSREKQVELITLKTSDSRLLTSRILNIQSRINNFVRHRNQALLNQGMISLNSQRFLTAFKA